MDNDHTQRQNSTSASGDQDEKLHEEEEKLNHNGQVESNNLEGEPVDTGQDSVSVVQGKKKKETSVPFWRLVSVHAVE